MSLRENLSEAGSRFDGHVTNGSLNEQIKAVASWLREEEWDYAEEMIKAIEKEIAEDDLRYPN